MTMSARAVIGTLGADALAWLARFARFASVAKTPGLPEWEAALQVPAGADLRARLAQVLEQLPSEQRVVVELAYRFKCSREEIAAILNCSVDSVADLMPQITPAVERLI
jgi:DNA-directed RNA polymerase specialized sigma24 family protein